MNIGDPCYYLKAGPHARHLVLAGTYAGVAKSRAHVLVTLKDGSVVSRYVKHEYVFAEKPETKPKSERAPYKRD